MDWSKFSFDFHLEYKSLFPHLIQIEAFKEAALNLVIPPDWKTKLEKLNRVRAVRGTTAIEGNPLSEEEAAIQIAAADAGKSEGGLTKEQLQIRNASIAQEWTRKRFQPSSQPLTCADLLEMHRMLTNKTDTTNNTPGKWRSAGVQVGSAEYGVIHFGAPWQQLSEMMQRYIEFVNGKKMADQHPVVKAMLSHFFLVTIHPFGDGNGRVSRLVEAGILYRDRFNVHGFYGLSNYFYRHEKDYKLMLQECRRKQPFDVTPFIRFGVEGFASELKGINNFIKTKLNRVVYREMLVKAFNRRVGDRRRLLNQREYSLLDFLLTETEPIDPFSDKASKQIKYPDLVESGYVRGAYKNFTARTFVRELFRLGEMGFIKFSKEGTPNDWVLELDFGAIEKY